MSAGGFWAMGHYGAYVWPCYGLALAVLGWNVWSARRHHERARVRAQRALAMLDTSS